MISYCYSCGSRIDHPSFNKPENCSSCGESLSKWGKKGKKEKGKPTKKSYKPAPKKSLAVEADSEELDEFDGLDHFSTVMGGIQLDEERSYYKNNNSESLRNIMGPANMKIIEENPASE
jgi:hypothetical protein